MQIEQPTNPRLSIVVIFHNMTREAKRTLHALSCAFQQGVTDDQYEVIAVENGMQTLDADWVCSHGENFQYHFHETSSPSPAAAVNFGAACARGDHVALIVDGARIPSPGLVGTTLKAISAFEPCFVSALAWHLGPDVQRVARLAGYDQAKEDAQLDAINWLKDGYRLFEIATLAPSSKCGFLNGLPRECSWLALPTRHFRKLGGYDEAFQSAGGGLVNHDFLHRMCKLDDLVPVQLLGEGTFHQIHNGAMTGTTNGVPILAGFKEEYKRVRGRDFVNEALPTPVYLGAMTESAIRFVTRAPS